MLFADRLSLPRQEPKAKSQGPTTVTRVRIEIHPDPETLAAAATEEISGWLGNDAHQTIGLAGGSTPRRTYELLAETGVSWDQVHVWLTDERHVPIDHPDSNGGMASKALVSRVPAHFHPVEFNEEAAVAAASYEETLARMWDITGSGTSSGLVILGIGEDGHTASLFPGSPALDEKERDYVANWVEDKNTWRLTATTSLLARAARTLFLVTGTTKAQVVADIVERGSDHPAAIVSRASSDPVWMLDQAAASRLRD